MVDENGKPWKRTVKSNAWYNTHPVSELDRLWMYTNYEVSRKMDFNTIRKLLKEDSFKNKERINILILDLYDIEQIKKRVEGIQEKTNFDIHVYGFCHDYELDECKKAFGEYNFMPNILEEEYEQRINELLGFNHIKNFDLVEATLILKDLKKPLPLIRMLAKYLNPSGGALFFKELDDDFVSAYPDEKGYVKKMIRLLSLDPGAGNRHLGKKMYSILKQCGADSVYISDEICSSASMPAKNKKKLIDAYFSYLIPEFQYLVADHPENDEYRAGLEWLEQNYDDAVDMFMKDDFYFRAGFISGYALFNTSDDDDDLLDELD